MGPEPGRRPPQGREPPHPHETPEAAQDLQAQAAAQDPALHTRRLRVPAGRQEQGGGAPTGRGGEEGS